MAFLASTIETEAYRVIDQATAFSTGVDATHGNYQSVLGVPTFYQPGGSAISLLSTAVAEVKDSIFRITGSADATKKAAFEVDGFTAATTRTFTLPNVNGTVLVDTGTAIAVTGGTGFVPSANSTTALRVYKADGSTVILNVDSTNAFVGIGNTPVTEFTVFSTSASDPHGIMSAQYSTDTNGARIHLRKSRGSVASPTTIVTGDTLGRLRFSGYDGSNFLQMASIDAISTGTIAATRVPTYLSFSVATDAAPSVLTEVFTVKNAATVGAGRFELANTVAGVPGVLAAGGQTFGSTFDRMIIFGNNIDVGSTRVNGSYSANWYQLEGDYENTTSGAGTKHWIEGSYNVIGTTGTTYRLFQAVADMADPTALAYVNVGISEAGYGTTNGSFQVIGIASANVLYDLKYTGTLTINTSAPILKLAQTGGGNGNKWIRSSSNNLEFIDTGFSYILHRMTDAGITTHNIVDTSTNAVTDVLIVQHALTTANAGANNIGVGLKFMAADSTAPAGSTIGTAGVQVGRIRYIWTNATHASRTGEGIISVSDSGGERDAAYVWADGTGAIFEVAAGYRTATRVVTAAGAVTVTNQDYVIEVNKTVGAATTVNLPAGVTNQRFIVKDGKGDAATNNITVTPAAGNIDGAGTYVINVNYGSVMIQYDGTKWIVLAKF